MVNTLSNMMEINLIYYFKEPKQNLQLNAVKFNISKELLFLVNL
jgi:hypothetical protein